MFAYRTEEQRMILEMVRRLAVEKVAPRAAEIDASNEFPADVKELFAENGLLKMALPEEYGGIGADVTTMGMVFEEISKVSFTAAALVMNIHLVIDLLFYAAGEEQKKRFFTIISEGNKMGSITVTEPSAGSDLSSVRTRAVPKGDSYIINGTKCFITTGGVSDLFAVFTCTDPKRRLEGFSYFMVERVTPGLSIGKIENPMGLRGAASAEVIMEDLRVPRENLLGQEGEGFSILVNCLNVERIWVAYIALGISQGALDYAVQYAKQRVQFGKPIAEFQGIQFMLADMAVQTETARSVTYKAASQVDHGIRDVSSLSAIAKCFASDTAMKVTTDAVQILGGYGYMKDYPVERMMRDAKGTQIVGGTNQIQRVLVARSLLGK